MKRLLKVVVSTAFSQKVLRVISNLHCLHIPDKKALMKTNFTSSQSMRFERLMRRRTPWRTWVTFASGLAFTAFWWLLPQALTFWLLLPVILILTWLATYGWRVGLRIVRSWLDTLEQLGDNSL